MAKKKTGGRMFEFLGGLPLWSRRPDSREEDALKEEQKRLSSVQAQLLDILNSETLISTGRVQILGLDGLKEKLGSRWESHRDSIHTSLKAIARRKLSAHDVFFQHGDDEYVIVFSSLSFAAAKLVCAGILQELSTFLLGDESNQSIAVRTAVGVVDGKILSEASTIDDILRNIEHAEETSQEIDSTGNKGPIEHEHAQSADEDNDAAGFGWQKIDFESSLTSASARVWVPIDDDAADKDVSLDQFQLIYRPMWNPGLETITTFAASFVATGEDGQLKNAYSQARGSKLVRRMDVSVLVRASHKVAELFRQRQRFLMAIPHHYESVASWSRVYEYAEHCKSIPEEVRKYLALSCDDFPVGVPSSKLAMIGNALAPYCRNLAANVNWAVRDLSLYRDAGFSVVAIFVPQDMPRTLVKARIDDFAETGRRLGLRTAVLNVHDLELGEIVRDAGIDFVMGRLIGDYQKEPSHMVKLSWDEIRAGERAETPGTAARRR
jgi:hypothetical protein